MNVSKVIESINDSVKSGSISKSDSEKFIGAIHQISLVYDLTKMEDDVKFKWNENDNTLDVFMRNKSSHIYISSGNLMMSNN